MFDFSGVSVNAWKIIVTILVTIAIMALIVVIYRFASKRKINRFETRDLTYGAVCIAVAYALSFFGYEMPNGGTITPASTVPIILYCYYFGFAKAVYSNSLERSFRLYCPVSCTCAHGTRFLQRKAIQQGD